MPITSDRVYTYQDAIDRLQDYTGGNANTGNVRVQAVYHPGIRRDRSRSPMELLAATVSTHVLWSDYRYVLVHWR